MNSCLIISYHFPPSGGPSAAASIRVGKFAKYLPNFNWEPIVVSPGNESFTFIDESLEDVNSVIHYRIKDPVKQFKGYFSVNKLLPEPGLKLGWVLRAVYESIDILKKHQCKIIFCSSPPPASFIVGYLVSKLTKTPLVLDYRDQYTLSPYRYGPRIFKYWDKFVENLLLQQARLVVVTNQKRLLEHKHYWQHVSNVLICIANGYDLEDFERIKDRNHHLKSKINQKEILIRYLGSIYGSRIESIKSFLNSLNNYLLNSGEDISIRLQFYGNFNKQLSDINNQSERIIIEIFGYTTHDNSLSLMMSADALLLIIGQHSQSSSEITSKIYEYIACGKPIIVVGQSTLIEEYSKMHQQIIAMGSNPSLQTIYKATSFILNYRACDDLAIYHKHIEEIIGDYSRINLTNKLASWFDNLISQLP